jgi:nucleoside-diphosphate-sugar epimerase
LVTGGAGYIGSVLVADLLADGHKVTVLDHFPTGVPLASVCASPSFDPVRGDCRDARRIDELIVHADCVIPLAALVGAPICDRDPIGAQTVNADAIRMLVSKLSRSQMIVIPTTNSGYGIGESNVECTEESPLRPISLYGRTKVEAESVVLGERGGISLRLATAFGMSPRMRIDLLVNDFTYRAMNDHALVVFEGHFRRNFIHVRDISKAFRHAIENYSAMKGNAFNVGLSSANLSKLDLCRVIKKHVPDFVFVEAKVGEDLDKRDYIVSNRKIEATGYRADFSIDDGIVELIKGYRMLRNSRFGNV